MLRLYEPEGSDPDFLVLSFYGLNHHRWYTYQEFKSQHLSWYQHNPLLYRQQRRQWYPALEK